MSLDRVLWEFLRKWQVPMLKLVGTVSGTERILLKDKDGKKLLVTGTTKPSDSTTGYAKGCIFIDTDVGAGSSGIYENVGTTTSCNFDALSAASPTAWDDIAAPDAAATIAFGTYAQTITSGKTNGDMLTVKGIGNFGDVSVMRVESSTGNPTDGTVLEAVSHDANVDPFVASALNKANAFVVQQDGKTAVANGLVLGAFGSEYMSVTVSLTAGEIKALRATKKELVAAPGSGKMLELVSAVLKLNYGSEVLTESVDNMVIQYNTSGVDATGAIEATGFIDASANTTYLVKAADIAAAASTNLENKALELFNTGDGEYGGNASADTTMTVIVNYRVHTL
jgi:hypothetical protein